MSAMEMSQESVMSDGEADRLISDLPGPSPLIAPTGPSPAGAAGLARARDAKAKKNGSGSKFEPNLQGLMPIQPTTQISAAMAAMGGKKTAAPTTTAGTTTLVATSKKNGSGLPAATTNDDIADIDEASPDPEPHSTSLSQHHFEDSDNDDQEDNDESATYTNTELAVLQNSTSAAVLKIWQNTQVKIELLKNEKPLHGYFDDQFALGVKGVRKQGKADLADANHASLEKVKNLAAEFHKQRFHCL